MRFLSYALMILFTYCILLSGQDTLAFQGFESGDSWTISSGGANISADSGYTDYPDSSRVRSGLNSWQVNNESATLVLSATSVSGYENVEIAVRVASTALASGNGADGADFIRIFVNVDGAGYPVTQDIELTGNNNAKWDYDAALSETTTAGTPASVSAPQGGVNSNNYGILVVQIPNGSSSVALQLVGQNNSDDEIWNIDDVTLTGTLATSETRVLFFADQDTVTETDGSYNLLVSIQNPDMDNATSAEVVLISGAAADIGDYTTQNITFSAGSSSDEGVTIIITDNSDIEGHKDFLFEIQNISGGNNAAAGSPIQFTLTILDDDIPKILITEVMQNPDDVSDASGEWFELFNYGAVTIDINGWIIRDLGSNNHTVNNGSSLNIAPNNFLVLGNNSDSGTNGDLQVDYEYSGITIGNTDDEIILYLSDGITEVDRVEYDGGPGWPNPTGASMVFTGSPHQNNNDGSLWAVAQARESTFSGTGTDLGSPGSNGSDQSLPIELVSFTGTFINGTIELHWTTASELHNLGFILMRKRDQEKFEEISSYRTNSMLRGQGSSSESCTYHYRDSGVCSGKLYQYKLIDAGYNGVLREHPIIEVSDGVEDSDPVDKSEKFRLDQNFPNPFNPSTKICFYIAELNNSSSPATLIIYNVLGRTIKKFDLGNMPVGEHTVLWNGTNCQNISVTGGVYFYKLVVGTDVKQRKMILIR